MNPILQLAYQPQQSTNQLVLHPGPPISQIPPKEPIYLQNTIVSSRTQEEKDEMRELTEQMKKLSSKVTYLRNQNNQLYNSQRNQQYASQGQHQGQYQNQGYQRPTRTWNTRPNNGGVPTPLDNLPASENRPTNRVFLAEAALSNWCRLHNTNQHSELQCDEFQVAANIFHWEVENTTPQPVLPPSRFEIVSSPRYDTALVLETYIPRFFFPNQDENEVADPNHPADVNAFQQYQRGIRGYYNNNNKNSNSGPYTTSMPPKDTQVFPDQNASNNPNYPKASQQYASQGQSQKAQPPPRILTPQNQPTAATNQGSSDKPSSNIEITKLGQLVADEFKKIKVSLSLVELMKVSEVRDVVLGSLRERSPVQSKGTDENSEQSVLQGQPQKISNEVRGPTNPRGATVNYAAPPEFSNDQPMETGFGVRARGRTQDISIMNNDTLPSEPTISLFTEKLEPPPFLLTLRIFGKFCTTV